MEQYIESFNEIIQKSLSIQPNNKKNIMQLDRLKKHSGYIQWYLIEENDNVSKDVTQRKSNIMIKENELDANYNVMDNDEKKKLFDMNHEKCQNIMHDCVNYLTNYIHENPHQYQGEIARNVGISNDKYHDNNRIISTFLDIMCQQEILKKYTENRHCYFEVINSKEYDEFKRCDIKYASKLEAELAEYLISSGIDFQQQVTYKDCVDKKNLRYDFLIKINDEEFLVEVNGKQHYQHIPYFHKDIEDFEKQIKHDKMKYEHANEKNIPLLIIKYDEPIVKTFETYIEENEYIKNKI